MDTHSIIKQLTEQLSNSPLEEERIKELCPINFIWDYYDNPKKINVGKKKYTIKWKDEESRIKEINRINKIIAEYSGTKAKPPIKPFPLWAFNCYPIHEVNPNSISNQIEDLKYWTIDDEELFKTRVEIRTVDFIEYLNKEIFNYIQSEIRKAKDLEAWDGDNMWYEPNKRFVKWFQIKNIDPDSKVLKKDDTNNSLWAIAEDMRARKEDGDFDTYIDAYRWAEKNMSRKGVNITAKKLERAYHKAKSEGIIE